MWSMDTEQLIMSPSSQRAWIEILVPFPLHPHMLVALLAEGVDRNRASVLPPIALWVALLAEGVDRNEKTSQCSGRHQGSPSSQRAWIEISPHSIGAKAKIVALLAEGVDRNPVNIAPMSPSYVALLAEGVDRNRWISLSREPSMRSPSSQRAWIEIIESCQLIFRLGSPSSRRAWIEIFLTLPRDP